MVREEDKEECLSLAERRLSILMIICGCVPFLKKVIVFCVDEPLLVSTVRCFTPSLFVRFVGTCKSNFKEFIVRHSVLCRDVFAHSFVAPSLPHLSSFLIISKNV